MEMPSLSGARIAIVGGAGFVGSNLSHRLLQDDAKAITIVDNLLSADASNVPDDARVRFVEGTITDDAVLGELKDDLDVVFHLACFHGNQSSIADPLADHRNNALTSLKLFEHLKGLSGLTKVVYAAAGCAVAKKTANDPAATPEDAPVDLFHDSPYSISKLVGEMYGNYYFERHDLPFVKARFQNVYGPREVLGAGRWRGTPHTVWRNVTPTFIFRALHGEALPLINGGQDGRDFIFVEDLVEGLIRMAVNGEPGEAYNLASGKETRILDLANTINELAGNKTPAAIEPPRDWDRSGRRYGDPFKSQKKLGFAAGTGLSDGLARTIAWTNDNLETIKTCMAQHADHVPEVRKYL